MQIMFPLRLVSRYALILCFVSASAAQNLTVRQIMAEPSIAGMRVEGEKLSPDGSKVVYLWNAEGIMPRDIYLVSTSGGEPARLVNARDLPAPTPAPTPENKLTYGLTIKDDFARSREGQVSGLEWSPDSRKMVFLKNGDIFTCVLSACTPKRLTHTQAAETSARFLDNDRILYQQNGNIFVLNTADATLVQLSKEADAAKFISVSNVTPNKEGSLVAYVVSDASKQKALFVPNYLGEFVLAPTVRRGWSEQKILVVPADGSRDTPFEIKLPKAEGVSHFRRMVWAADNRSLIVDRADKDTKRRQLFYIHNAASKDEQVILVTEETDDKWIAPLSSIVEPNPRDPRELIFCSERDGFNHIYFAKLKAETRPVASVSDPSARVQEGGERLTTDVKITQLTKGNWQVEWAKWDARVDDILFLSTAYGTSGRRIEAVNLGGNISNERMLSRDDGMIESPQISTDGADARVIYGFSEWDRPTELFARRVCNIGSFVCDATEPASAPIKLTSTIPQSFLVRKWNTPKFIDIPSRDGKQIKSKIYLPTGFDQKKKYPMVIFVHGAGYLQNTINGWNNYYREFMFNELLTQKGYVVLDIDYRGSAGYGRDWRTDVYDFLGGKDYDDHIDAIDYMVKNYAVNPAKVGVYGGSYGGFMAEMLAMRAPDKIAAAAALRPVADWKNYYASSPGYTAERLGFPDKNPNAYERSSPITYADKLERPLLILHGEVDSNVPVQDSMQLVEKLIRSGKSQYIEVMFYPSENHGFERPESWTDEYERILAFFEKHLK